MGARLRQVCRADPAQPRRMAALLLAVYCAFLLAGPIHLLTHEHAPPIVLASADDADAERVEVPSCSCRSCHAAAKEAARTAKRDTQPALQDVPRSVDCGCTGPCSLCQTLFQTFIRTDDATSVRSALLPRTGALAATPSVLVRSQRRLHGARAPPVGIGPVFTTV